MQAQLVNVRGRVQWLALMLVPALLVATQAKGDDEDRGKLSGSDYKFVRKAACGGMAEVSLGRLAAEQASSQAVKHFGQQMVTDHSKANDELKQVVASKGATLPDQLTKSDQKELEHLRKLSGSEFDREYMKHMVRDHKEDVKEFKKAAEDAKDPEVRAFAAKTLPILQDHLKLAEDVEASLKRTMSKNGRVKEYQYQPVAEK